MLRLKLTLFFGVFIHCVSAQNLESLAKLQWLSDFDKLAVEIQARHVNPYSRVPKQKYYDKITNLGYSLDDLSVKEKLVELIRLANLPGDGKTAVQVEHFFNYYPIDLFWFEGGLRIDKIDSKHKKYAGWKVIGIDGKKVTEITPIIHELIPPGENIYYRLKWDQKWLRNADILNIQGITKSPEQAVYTLQDDNGNIENVNFTAVSFDQYGEIEWTPAYFPDPRFMQTHNKDYSITVYDEFTVFVNIKKYPPESVLKEETTKLLDILENQGYTHLIIDIRGNDDSHAGGIDYMIKKLSKSDFNDHGIIYLITDRDTFGNAFLDIFKMKDELGALPVGEPPAQNPNGYEIGFTDLLPNSKIRYTIAGSIDKLQEEEGNLLIMHKLINPHFQKRKDRVDEVMEWISSQP